MAECNWKKYDVNNDSRVTVMEKKKQKKKDTKGNYKGGLDSQLEGFPLVTATFACLK